MGLRLLLSAAVAVLHFSVAHAARPLDFDRTQDPASLCRALAPYGLDAGDLWRESASRSGGWACERNGALRECGRAGEGAAAGRIAYAVFGSGRWKIDRAVLQLTIDAAESDACRTDLRELAAVLASVVGVRLPARIAELVSQPRAAREPPSGMAAGRAASRQVLHEERQGWVRVRLTAEESRLTVLTVTFANPNASRVWD